MRAWLSSLGLGTWIRRVVGVRLGRLQQYPPKMLSAVPLVGSGSTEILPTIALVTPSYNQAKFVGQTINSVVKQNYPNLQYVIQDAGSLDGTKSVLETFANTGFDIHIEPDRGQADALNKGFQRTSAEIMGYLNSDDMLLPGTLHLVAHYFNNNPSVDVIYGNRFIVDETGNEVGRWILPDHDPKVLRFIDYVPQESMFWRRRIWDRVGAKFDENLQFAMDWDLILRFINSGAVFHHVSSMFGVFRVHGEQKTQANFALRGAQEMAALRARYRDINQSRLQSIFLHGYYLYRHLKIDAKFAVTSCIKKESTL